MLESDSQPGASHKLPYWAWGLLAVLAVYQALMYGWVMRIHVNHIVAGMPWLLRRPDYRLYENVVMPYTPLGFWLQMGLYNIIPDPVLRNRVAMIGVALLSMGLVFWLAYRWWGLYAGLAGVVLYAAWGPVIMNYIMYFDVLLGVFGLCALAAWHKTQAAWWQPALAGLFAGLGILTKQQGLAVTGVFIIWRVLAFDWRHFGRDMALFLIANALPMGLFLVGMALQGRLADTIFWTWTYIWSAFYENAARWPEFRETFVILAWLILVPLFAWFVIPRREQWKSEGILLLGLLPGLGAIAFPRYSRFHFSGVVPVVALIGAGAVAYALRYLRSSYTPPATTDVASAPLARGANRGERSGVSAMGGKRWSKYLLKGYLGAASLCVAAAFILPTSYRIRLGPRIGDYAPLIPIAEELTQEYDVQPGTRIWLVPDIDPTTNLYSIGGFLPPATFALAEPWYHAVPGYTERVIDQLDVDPPEYAVVFERWRGDEPAGLLDYLNDHYTPVGEMSAPGEYGQVTFYALK